MQRISRLGFLPRLSRLYSTELREFEGLGYYDEIFPDTSTEEARELLRKPQCVYAGFDPTADSLHVGNLLVLTALLKWQRRGHQVVALLGGATGKIGDPSHRSSERTEISDFVLSENLNSIKQDIEKIFKNHEEFIWKNFSSKVRLKPPVIVNNENWYTDQLLLPFIREVATHFRMGTLLGRASVQARLSSPSGMSFAEFTYQMFQAYDWLELSKRLDCRFQLGGNDQTGNIMSGYELIARKTNTRVFGLTLPLLTTEGGKKFGKSSGNAVWLSSRKSSSFQLYQYLVRVTDAEVPRLLRLLTFLREYKIKELEKELVEQPEKRTAQRVLAEQVTLLVHGEEGLAAAKRASSALYEGNLESLASLRSEDLLQLFEGAKLVEIRSDHRDVGGSACLTAQELSMRAKCFKTERDARRIIEAGGFSINHRKIVNPDEAIVPGIHILSNRVSLLRVGKKSYFIARWL